MGPTTVLSIHYKTLFKMNNKNYKNIIDNQVSKTDSEPKLYMNGYRMVSCKEVEIQDVNHLCFSHRKRMGKWIKGFSWKQSTWLNPKCKWNSWHFSHISEIQDGCHCSTFLSLDPQYWKMNISIFYEWARFI